MWSCRTPLPGLANHVISSLRMEWIRTWFFFFCKQRSFWIEIICTIAKERDCFISFLCHEEAKILRIQLFPLICSRGYCWRPPTNQFNFKDSVSIDETGLALMLAFSEEQMSWLPMRTLPLLTSSECTRAALTSFSVSAAANIKEEPPASKSLLEELWSEINTLGLFRWELGDKVAFYHTGDICVPSPKS